jgi:hypothetical protein
MSWSNNCSAEWAAMAKYYREQAEASEEETMAKATAREGEARKTPEEVQAEVDAMVQPLADYLVEASDHNLPIAHRAGQLLREASSLIVTVASSPEPPVELVPPPGGEEIPVATKMAPLFEPAHK